MSREQLSTGVVLRRTRVGVRRGPMSGSAVVEREGPATILVVDDDDRLVSSVRRVLAYEGYRVLTATSGPEGLKLARDESPDLIILDVMLPQKLGFDVCRDLRQRGLDTAILMVTARAQVMDRVVGLRLGADDYLSKPFHPAELLARVDALLRRVRKSDRPPVRTFQFGDVEADFDRAEVRKRGRAVNMAAKELQLLRYLVEHRERVVTRQEIMQQVWEYSKDASSRTIDVHVAWLRQKLENQPQSPKHIQTIRGRGYRFTA